MSTIADKKKLLRAEMKARRGSARKTHAGLSAASPEAAMRAHLAASGLLADGAVVSAFLAIGEEIDAVSVLDGFNVTIALPVMVAKAHPLQFRAWRPGDPLVDRMWGIREPADTAEVVRPDILLVPLLAFDARGFRLGYGGGFYDRTLQELRSEKAVTAIGVAFDEQRVDAVPRDGYDQSLDWVLTPSGLLRCLGS